MKKTTETKDIILDAISKLLTSSDKIDAESVLQLAQSYDLVKGGCNCSEADESYSEEITAFIDDNGFFNVLMNGAVVESYSEEEYNKKLGQEDLDTKGFGKKECYCWRCHGSNIKLRTCSRLGRTATSMKASRECALRGQKPAVISC